MPRKSRSLHCDHPAPMTSNPHNPAMSPHAWTSGDHHTALAVEEGKKEERVGGGGGGRNTETNSTKSPLCPATLPQCGALELCLTVLKTGINFDYYGLKSAMVFKGTIRAYKRICLFNYK